MKEKSWKQIEIAGITSPGSSKDFCTGGWRTQVPVLDRKKCASCLTCVIYCPENIISVENDKIKGFDFNYCKGCGICAEVCPVKAIQMKKEDKK